MARTPRNPGKRHGRPARLLVAVPAAVALLLSPSLFTESSAQFAATTSATGGSVQTATLAAPTGLSVTQTCPAGPGISHVAAASAAGTDSLTFPIPAGTTAGDVLVAQVTNRHTAYPLSLPAGWQQIGGRVTSGATNGASVTSAAFYRLATASEPATATFSLTGGTYNAPMVGGVSVYRGVQTSSPVDATATNTGNTATVTTPSVVTTRGGALVLHLVVKREESLAPPSGTTHRWRLTSGSGGAILGASAGDEIVASQGATTSRSTASSTNFASEWIGRTIALRPAPGPPSASLTWTASTSTGATGYVLERVVGGTVQSSSTVTPITATSATDGPLVSGTAYAYRLRARSGTWVSDDATAGLTPSC